MTRAALVLTLLGGLAYGQDAADPKSVEFFEKKIRPILSEHFKPALLARMCVVPYYPVSGPVLRELVEIKLDRLGERLRRRQLGFSYCGHLVSHLVERCSRNDRGARLIDQLLDQHLMPLVADRLLAAMAGGEPLRHVHAVLKGEAGVACEFS